MQACQSSPVVVEALIRLKQVARTALLEEFKRSVSEALADVSDAIYEQSQDLVPSGASNSLRDSGHRIPPVPTDWAMVRYTAPYAAYVHEGTRPHWPPSGVLTRWIELVLQVKDPKEVKRLDFLIRRKIAKYGTKPQPFLRDAAEEVILTMDDVFQRKFEEAASRLARQFGGG